MHSQMIHPNTADTRSVVVLNFYPFVRDISQWVNWEFQKAEYLKMHYLSHPPENNIYFGYLKNTWQLVSHCQVLGKISIKTLVNGLFHIVNHRLRGF